MGRTRIAVFHPVRMARILLIDDDDSVREMVALLLKHSGHTVIEARDGQEGLDLFPQAAADLVITDMHMPRKDGLEVLRALQDSRPPVKVIAISGGETSAIKHPLDTARLLGAMRTLAKPFSHSALLDAVNGALPHGAASPAGG
jgi:CheY-like chemotaxis protein